MVIVAKVLLVAVSVLVAAGMKYKEKPSPLGIPIGFAIGLVACFL